MHFFRYIFAAMVLGIANGRPLPTAPDSWEGILSPKEGIPAYKPVDLGRETLSPTFFDDKPGLTANQQALIEKAYVERQLHYHQTIGKGWKHFRPPEEAVQVYMQQLKKDMDLMAWGFIKENERLGILGPEVHVRHLLRLRQRQLQEALDESCRASEEAQEAHAKAQQATDRTEYCVWQVQKLSKQIQELGRELEALNEQRRKVLNPESRPSAKPDSDSSVPDELPMDNLVTDLQQAGQSMQQNGRARLFEIGGRMRSVPSQAQTMARMWAASIASRPAGMIPKPRLLVP